jgi:chloride channel 3/4/5
MGSRPRVILVEKFGSLVGLITVKDVLRFIELEEATHMTIGRQSLGSRLSLEGALEEAWMWMMDRTSRLFR